MTERRERPAPQVRLTTPGSVPATPPAPGRARQRTGARGAAGLVGVAGLVVAAVVVSSRSTPPAAPAPAPAPSAPPAPARAVLYVPSCSPDTVYRVQADGSLAQLSGTPARGTTADGHSVRVSRSDCPDGLAFDGAGVLQVVGPQADRVRLVGEGGVITGPGTRAGITRPGPTGSTTSPAVADRRTAPGLRALLLSPEAVATGPGGLVYVGGPGSTRVRRLDDDGVLRPLAPRPPTPLAAVDEPARPALVAVDGELSTFYADFGTGLVFEVRRDGRAQVVAGTAARTGRAAASGSGDGGPATSAVLDDPRAVAAGPDGSLYVTEGAGRRVRRIAPDGTISTVAGTGRPGSSGDGGPATAATFTSPGDVAVDAAGTVYVVDLRAGAVRRFVPGGTISTLGG